MQSISVNTDARLTSIVNADVLYHSYDLVNPVRFSRCPKLKVLHVAPDASVAVDNAALLQ